MALNLQDKKSIVSEVNEVAKLAISAVVATYSKVSVSEITNLRKQSRINDVYIKVIRNTLLSKIIKNTSFDCLNSKLNGPTIVAFSTKEPGTAARILKDFSKKNKNFKITAASFNGELFVDEKVDFLAELPTYNEAIIKLMITFKELIAGRLIRTLININEKK